VSRLWLPPIPSLYPVPSIENDAVNNQGGEEYGAKEQRENEKQQIISFYISHDVHRAVDRN
jgi:hypothetical protein